MRNHLLHFFTFATVCISFQLYSAEAPLLVPQNAQEHQYIENRKLWIPHDQPGSLFTDPTQHDANRYMYIVHRPNRKSFANPESIADILISASLITQDHNKTFADTKCVFILSVSNSTQGNPLV